MTVLVIFLSQCFISWMFYYLCIMGPKLHDFSKNSTIVVIIEVSALILLDWIQFYYDSTHSIFSMHSHSYLKTHPHFDFSAFTLLSQFLLWSHTLHCWNNYHHKRGNSSCYVYTDIIVLIATYLYKNECSHDWLLLWM